MREKLHSALAAAKSSFPLGTSFPDSLKSLREVQTKAEERIAAIFNTALILAVVCELMNRAVVSEVSFAGLKVADLTLIRRFVPCALAYYIYSFMCLFALRRVLISSVAHLSHLLFGSTESTFWSLVAPPSTFNTSFLLSVLVPKPWQKEKRVMAKLIGFCLLLGPVAYLIYTYTRIFGEFGLADILSWASAMISTFFVIQGLLYIVDAVKIVDEANKRAPSEA